MTEELAKSKINLDGFVFVVNHCHVNQTQLDFTYSVITVSLH